MKTLATVHNMPQETEQYIVSRIYGNELWYWGSFSDLLKAEKNSKRYRWNCDGIIDIILEKWYIIKNSTLKRNLR